MKLGIYSVYDKAVGAYMQPFMVRSSGEAVRSFTEACNDPQKPFGKYASDYSLYHHGYFDDNSGLYDCGDPVRIISANEVITDDVLPPERQRQ